MFGSLFGCLYSCFSFAVCGFGDCWFCVLVVVCCGWLLLCLVVWGFGIVFVRCGDSCLCGMFYVVWFGCYVFVCCWFDYFVCCRIGCVCWWLLLVYTLWFGV